jgi:DNA end-binding protein Ku
MRSIWKGHIRFSLVTIPVRVYNALETSQKIHFNQLHKEDTAPIGYDKRCKKCSKVVSNDEIIKGYQYEPERYVIVDQEDIDKIKLKSTKIIDLEGFVDATEIQPIMYDSAYFAGPDGEVSSKAYSLLRETLKESGKVGIGKVVLREREDIVAIAPYKNGLALYKLHYPNEVRSVSEVPQLDGQPPLDESALKLARSLVDTMSTSMSQIELKDRYGDALREIINAKVEGKEIVSYAEEDQPIVDIMTALKESIEQAKRKPMVKATGAKTAADVEAESTADEEKPAKSRKRKAS